MKSLVFLLMATVPLWAEEPLAKLSGQVNAIPNVPLKGAASGGAYGSRNLRYVKKFDYNKLKNVVVYADPLDGNPPAPQNQTLVIKKGRYKAKVSSSFLVVSEGGYLVIENNTNQTLTLFSSPGSAASIGIEVNPQQQAMVQGKTKGAYFLKALEDSELDVTLVVVGAYFGSLDKTGRYQLTLPAGSYRVTAWHERFPPQVQTINLAHEENPSLDFSLSLSDLPKIP